jgi:hypothetical protein
MCEGRAALPGAKLDIVVTAILESITQLAGVADQVRRIQKPQRAVFSARQLERFRYTEYPFRRLALPSDLSHFAPQR